MKNTSIFIKQVTITMTFLLVGSLSVGILTGCSDDTVEADYSDRMEFDDFWEALGKNPKTNFRSVSMTVDEFYEKVGEPDDKEEIMVEGKKRVILYYTLKTSQGGMTLEIEVSAREWQRNRILFSRSNVKFLPF